MFALVQFIDDQIYHTCTTKSLKINQQNVRAKWVDNIYYPANIITYNDNLCLLQSIKQNIISNHPLVELCRSVGCNPTSAQEPSSVNNQPVALTPQQMCTDLEVHIPPDFRITTELGIETNHFGNNKRHAAQSTIMQLANKAVPEAQIVSDSNPFDFYNDTNTINIEYYVVENNSIDIGNNQSFSTQPFNQSFLEEQIVPHSDALNESDTYTSEDLNVPFSVNLDHPYIEISTRDIEESYPMVTTNGDCLPNSDCRSFSSAEQPVYEMSLEEPHTLDSDTFNISKVETYQDVLMENEEYFITKTNTTAIEDKRSQDVTSPAHTSQSGPSLSSTPIRTPYVYYDGSHVRLPSDEHNVSEAVGTITTNGDCLPNSDCRSFSSAEQPVYEMSLEEPHTLDSDTFNISEVETYQDVLMENEEYFITKTNTTAIEDKRSQDVTSPAPTSQSGPSISSTPIRTPYVYYDRSHVRLPNDEHNVSEAVGTLPVTLTNASKTRTFFCIYCKKHFAKFPQHLMVSHKSEPAVLQFMALPPGCPERRRLIETIRRNGDYIHNTESIHNSGNFYVTRRSYGNYNSLHYLPCPSCKGFFKKSTLRLHHKKCGGDNVCGKKSIHLGRSISRQLHAKACFTLRTRIFPILRDDECVNIIRYDFLAITLANYWCAMYADSHFDEMIRARLRLMGRLLLAVKSLDNGVTDFCSLMTPTKYDLVIAAINKVAGLNEQGTIYKAPTTATMLTTICKKAADIWQIECIKMNDFNKKKDAENFLHLFKYSSATAVQRTALENRLVHQRHKVVSVPATDDIAKLVAYLRNKRRDYYKKLQSEKEQISVDTWKNLASYTLISIMVFNRRRAGELERITLEDYASLHSIDSSNCKVKLSSSEALLAQRYKRIEIRGKLNRAVPVLVNWELQAALDSIISYREKVGVNSSNPYVFGLPSTDNRHRYLRACNLLREYSTLCGATNPHLLRGTQLRKHIATQCSVQDLSENVIKDVAHFMGHDKSIHDNIYRLPVNNRDILQMSKVLEMVQGGDTDSDDDSDGDREGGTQEKNSSTLQLGHSSPILEPVNEGIMESPNQGIIESANQGSASSAMDLELGGSRSISEKRKRGGHSTGFKRICGKKVPWSDEEKSAALTLFSTYLEKDKLPSISMLAEAIPNIPELANRSPTTVKVWLENELVRRRSSSSFDIDNENSKTIDGNTSLRYEGKSSRARWSTDMKQSLCRHFALHLKNSTLPSNRECSEFKSLYGSFQNKTIASIKTAIMNEHRRRNS